mgnify:CR=1 FL=1
MEYGEKMKVYIRPWLTVGDSESCSERIEAGCVHIYRSDMPDYDCQLHSHVQDYRLDYADGHELPVTRLRQLSRTLMGYLDDIGQIHIHCHTGETRSPTIALFALSLIEDRHPFDLLPDIYIPLWRQQERFANFCVSPLRDITRWYESR